MYMTNFEGCFAPLCVNFLSNPRRIHSGQKDKEKEECELLCAVICCKQPLLSPPPPHSARHLTCLWLYLSGLEGQGRAPPPHPYPTVMVKSEAAAAEIEDGL
jgi:hypothetical protein